MMFFCYLFFSIASGLLCDFLFKELTGTVFEVHSMDFYLVVISGILTFLAFVIYDLTTKTTLPSTLRELEDAKRQIASYKQELEYKETSLKARQEELQSVRNALEFANSRPVETEKIAQTVGNTLVGNRLNEIVAKATRLRDVYDRSCQLQSENEKLKEDGRNQEEILKTAKNVIRKQLTEIEKLRHTVVEQRRMQHYMEEVTVTKGFASGELRRSAKMLRAEQESTKKPKNTPATTQKEFVPSRPRK